MCGAEALLLALKLATELVHPEFEPPPSDAAILRFQPCEFGRLRGPEYYRCKADALDAENKRKMERNEKVAKFREMAAMCLKN